MTAGSVCGSHSQPGGGGGGVVGGDGGGGEWRHSQPGGGESQELLTAVTVSGRNQLSLVCFSIWNMAATNLNDEFESLIWYMFDMAATN